MKDYGQQLSSHQEKLTERLIVFLKKHTGKWGGYCSVHPEADPHHAISQTTNIQWCYPRITGSGIEFYSDDKGFEINKYGIKEPLENAKNHRDIQSLDGLLVPGVGFQKNGNRLGRGMGFYDRAMQDYQGLKVGVAFSFQLIEGKWEQESHDIKMDYIITETEIIRC